RSSGRADLAVQGRAQGDVARFDAGADAGRRLDQQRTIVIDVDCDTANGAVLARSLDLAAQGHEAATPRIEWGGTAAERGFEVRLDLVADGSQEFLARNLD